MVNTDGLVHFACRLISSHENEVSRELKLSWREFHHYLSRANLRNSEVSMKKGASLDSILWKDYSNEVSKLLRSVDENLLNQSVQFFRATINAGGSIWIAGNGGSAATAAHFAVDLSKGASARLKKSVRAISIMDWVPTLTAWSNDTNYRESLVHIIENFACAEKDLLVVFTCSGNSENIVKLCENSGKLPIPIIAFTGFDGGKVRRLCDLEINVSSVSYQQIEDVHLAIAHYLSISI